jgi:hypothetical protein
VVYAKFMTGREGLAGLRLFIALGPQDQAYLSALTSRAGPGATITQADPDSDLAAVLGRQVPAPDVVITTLEAADRWLAGDTETGNLPLVVLAGGADPDAYERVLRGRSACVEYLKKASEPNIEMFFSALRNAARRAHLGVPVVNTL